MDALFAHVTFWHWWTLALVLIVLEVLTPGTFFLFMGIAAALLGALLAVIPMSWEWQLSLYAVLSIATTVGGRMWLKRRPVGTDRPTLNRRGAQYVGRTFTLDEPIDNGLGKIRVDDTTWKVEGDDCAAGSKVKVVGVDGTILRVEPVN